MIRNIQLLGIYEVHWDFLRLEEDNFQFYGTFLTQIKTQCTLHEYYFNLTRLVNDLCKWRKCNAFLFSLQETATDFLT